MKIIVKHYLNRTLDILHDEGPVGFIKTPYRFVKRRLFQNQDKLYKKWVEKVEVGYLQKELTDRKIFKTNPKISLLVPVYNVAPRFLKEVIDSVKAQWYENWELCLYDDASTNHETRSYLETLIEEQDQRVKIKFGTKNQNISLATNEAFEMASGGYLMLMDNDDTIAPNALYEAVKVINEQGEQDLIYFDEDKLDPFNKRVEPFFKGSFSYELMWSMMYPTHAIFSRQIFQKAGKMRRGYEGSQDYDLVLRVMELTDRIYHIPWVLYHWRKIPGSTAQHISGKSYALSAAKRALSDALERRTLKGTIVNEFYPFVPKLEVQGNPNVEIIIPFKDKIELLDRCLRSIFDHTKYRNFVVTIVDNNSQQQKTFDYLGHLEDRVKILKYPHKFNFSAINNFAAKQSKADFFLFLNNDTQIHQDNWLEDLLVWAQQKEIGAVGCKLVYPKGDIQHAGILVGVGGIANHVYYRQPKTSQFYFNNLNCVRNYLAVTAACMMVSKKKFNDVGMFNEKLPGAFNDVDFCLSLVEKGYRNVYTPQVEITHFESRSRNPKVNEDERSYMYQKWGKYIKNDPYYNPHLNRNLEMAPAFSLPLDKNP